jgi:hypothetical protein
VTNAADALVAERLERTVLRAGSIVIYPSPDPESPIEIAWATPSGPEPSCCA